MDRALNVSLIALCWSVVLAVMGIEFIACARVMQVASSPEPRTEQLSAFDLRR